MAVGEGDAGHVPEDEHEAFLFKVDVPTLCQYRFRIGKCMGFEKEGGDIPGS